MNLKGVLEGILFAVGDEGVTLNQICDILSIDMDRAKEILKELKSSYEVDDRGIRISYLGDAFKLTTKQEHKEYFQKLLTSPQSDTLSPSSLETLAIIAYNQPITRIEVDNLRGVNTSYVIRKLVAKGFIKEVGKSTMPGRPNLYRTTSEFLDYFGLATLNDLPVLEDNTYDIKEEEDLFGTIYKEEDML